MRCLVGCKTWIVWVTGAGDRGHNHHLTPSHFLVPFWVLCEGVRR